MLAAGGNAADAAVAAAFVLAVACPYHCGLGGDASAIVWDGVAHGVLSIGAAPAGLTVGTVRVGSEPSGTTDAPAAMPSDGPFTVTVPGAVAGWLDLLEAFGTWPRERVLGPAIRLAEEGVTVSVLGGRSAELARRRFGATGSWAATFGAMRAGGRFVQTALAATLGRIAAQGAAGFYAGETAERLERALAAAGGPLRGDDLASHRVRREPVLHREHRGLRVLQLPPPTQGPTALLALGILARQGDVPSDPVTRTHLQIESVRLALAERERTVGDPDGPAGTAAGPDPTDRLAGLVRRDRALPRPRADGHAGGTAYLCASDADGLVVSLIQSNFEGFGSGVAVPELGFGLHNRGAAFVLDEDSPRALAPGRRPFHTLIPALALRGDEPVLVLGTMGGDSQPQIQVQLLEAFLRSDGTPLGGLLAAPRWSVDAADGSVHVEADLEPDVVAGLRRLGHDVRPLQDPWRAGHAGAIAFGPDGRPTAAASDPRSDGAAAIL